MYIVHVFIKIKPECVDDFIDATMENVRKSILEPGIARFDFIQQIDDLYRFVLVEVYRTPNDPAEHKMTAHYLAWRDRVETMIAEPRMGIKYANIYPEEEGWG